MVVPEFLLGVFFLYAGIAGAVAFLSWVSEQFPYQESRCVVRGCIWPVVLLFYIFREVGYLWRGQ